MKSKLLFLLLGLVAFTATFAQTTTYPFEDWVSTAGSQNFFYKNVTRTYGLDTYVAGATVNDSGNYDILLIKYSSSGTINWTKQYNGAGNGNDMAADLLVDATGVFLVGTTYKNSTNNQDAIIFKFTTGGTQQWAKTYNGTGSSYDGFTSLCTNGTNIYTGGGSFGTGANSDYIVNSFRISDGNPMWVSRYNSTYNLHDLPTKITYTTTGSPPYPITISGGMQYTTTNWKFGTVTYNTSGTMGAATLSGTNSDGLVRVTDVTTDASGNTYVVGAIQNTGQYDWRVIKLNTSLAEAWAVNYDGGSSLEDCPMSIKEYSGNLYVTGFATVTGQGRNIVTKKYKGTDGSTLWTKTFNGATNGNDEGGAIVLDNSGNVYVGATTNNGSNSDFITTKYNNSGTQQWQLTYNSIANTDDKVADIAMSGASDIIVTGQSGVGTSLSYLTVKYTQKSLTLPPDPEPINPAFAYIENRGQLLDNTNAAVPNIRFYNKKYAPNVYFSDSSITYVTAKLDTSLNYQDTLHRIDIKFTKQNTNDKIRALSKREDYINFYSGTNFKERTPLYNYLVHPSIFTNIDMYCGSNSAGYKLYFVCKPGFTLADLQLVFSGQSSITVNGSGALVLGTSTGNIIHPKATVYQINSSGAYVSLGWQPTYTVTTNKLAFSSLGTYNASQPLVIEMNLGPNNPPQTTANGNMDWSTFYGNNASGGARDAVFDVKTDKITGEPYIGGFLSSASLPHNTGITNGQFQGNTDGFVQAFKPNAEPKWMDWIGSGGLDQLTDLDLSGSYIYTTGQTHPYNGIDFPTIQSSSSGAYYDGTYSPYLDPNNVPTYYDDIFIQKLRKNDGVITWSTLYGSPYYEVPGDIIIDNFENVIVTGYTETRAGEENGCQVPSGYNNFPLCNPNNGNYFQSVSYPTPGVVGDIFIAKFNSNENLTWSTFFGSDNMDRPCELALSNDNFFLVGWTTKDSDPNTNYIGATGPISGNFPLCNPNLPGEYFQAGDGSGQKSRGFLASFDHNNTLEWCTYVQGIKAFNSALAIDDNIYVGGFSESPSCTSACSPGNYTPICSTNVGATCENNSGSNNSYIARFNAKIYALNWSTFVPNTTINTLAFNQSGAFNKIKNIDIASDEADNIYVTSSATSNSFSTLSSTPSGMYYNSTFNGGTGTADIVLLSYSHSNIKRWATYFGSDGPNSPNYPIGSDSPSEITTYKNNALYIVGCAGNSVSSNFPLLDYNSGSNIDYYQAHSPENDADGFVSRFNLQSIGVGLNEELVIDEHILIYPNPSNSIINISLLSPDLSSYDYDVKIYDGLGKLCFNQNYKKSAKNISIDIAKYANGMYLIQLTNNKRIFTGKFIKQ